MYKIPDDLELHKLKYKLISQIAFGLNVITLFFDNDLLQFSGSFILKIKQEIFYYEEVYPVKQDFGLLELLGLKIVDIYTNNERNALFIEFEGDNALTLLSNELFESFEINIDGRRTII